MTRLKPSSHGIQMRSTSARECALARLCGTEAGGHELSRLTLDVKGEFVVELPLDFPVRKEGADAKSEVPELHGLVIRRTS